MNKTVLVSSVEDLRDLEIHPKDRKGQADLWPDSDLIVRAESFGLRVWSPDLDSALVETSFGLTVAAFAPPSSAFFRPRISDYAFTYVCSSCLGSVGQSASGIVCYSCSKTYPHSPEWVPTWLCAAGRDLTVAAAATREDRKIVIGPGAATLRSAIDDHDFIADLVEWTDPYFDEPLTAHATAWELSDVLQSAWTGWKAARRSRAKARRLSAFRVLSETLSSPDWETWTRHPSSETGSSVPVKSTTQPT